MSVCVTVVKTGKATVGKEDRFFLAELSVCRRSGPRKKSQCVRQVCFSAASNAALKIAGRAWAKRLFL